jgi:hypothetical protein
MLPDAVGCPRPRNMPPLSLPACGQLSMSNLLQAAGPAGVTATLGRQRAGNGVGGKGVPALAQAARATCRLARRAATRRG